MAAGVFFAFLALPALGRRRGGGWAVDGAAVAARRRPLRRAGRAAGRRRDPRAARRCCPPCGRSAPARCACSPRSASAWPPARSASARAAPAVRWDAEWVRPRGGMVGEALYWGASTALGSVGAHIVAVFLFLAARAAAHRRVGRRRGEGHDRLGLDAPRATCAPRSQRRRPTEELERAGDACEPRGLARRRRRPSRVEWERAGAVLVGRGPLPRPVRRASAPEPEAEPEPRAGAGARAEPRWPRTRDRRARRDAARRPPTSRRRAATAPPVTESPDFEWTVPDPRFLKRSSAEAGRPDTAGQEKVAAQLVEALGHFGVEAQVIGMVAGPHITRYELRLAPGHQGRQGRPAQGRPRLRAGRRGHPHPRADPRQAGGRRRGPERAPADRAPRRRLPGAAGGLVAADRLARQGRRRPRDRRRPGQDAAPARRGHDRRRQVRLRQRDALLDPAARHAARGADGARRPQAGRAQPLRLDPAPADAGHHVAAQGRHRAAEPRARDGAALLVHVARPHALADRAQQGARARAARRRCRTSCA